MNGAATPAGASSRPLRVRSFSRVAARERWLAVVAMLALAVPALAAEEATRDAVAELPHLIDEVRAESGVPGVAVAVVQDGRVAYSGGVGWRDLKAGGEITSRTVFSVGGHEGFHGCRCRDARRRGCGEARPAGARLSAGVRAHGRLRGRPPDGPRPTGPSLRDRAQRRGLVPVRARPPAAHGAPALPAAGARPARAIPVQQSDVHGRRPHRRAGHGRDLGGVRPAADPGAARHVPEQLRDAASRRPGRRAAARPRLARRRDHGAPLRRLGGRSGTPDLDGRSPTVGLVLGSGLGHLAERVATPIRIPYADIPGFHVPTVVGHKGELVAGTLAGRTVIVQSGRFHMYEGYSADEAVLPVRVFAALGVSTLILTNAAGGINPSYPPGTVMLIRDHLNLTGRTPLLGHALPGEERFPDMTVAYDANLPAAARAAATAAKVPLEDGVFAGLLGPSYETPAEVAYLGKLGADAVGMSTVDRVAKYNQLLRIEEELGILAAYPGREAFYQLR